MPFTGKWPGISQRNFCLGATCTQAAESVVLAGSGSTSYQRHTARQNSCPPPPPPPPLHPPLHGRHTALLHEKVCQAQLQNSNRTYRGFRKHTFLPRPQQAFKHLLKAPDSLQQPVPLLAAAPRDPRKIALTACKGVLKLPA